MSRPEELIPIGKIIGAHGLDGVLRVHAYAESAECFAQPEGLVLIDPRGRQSRLNVLWVRPQKNGLRLALKEVSTRNQAEMLIGGELFIPRSSLPPLDDEETHYWIDLIGLTVYETDGTCLGRITDIIRTGANDVYVVATPPGFKVKEILVPAISSVVREVDVVQGVMRVALPEGLI